MKQKTILMIIGCVCLISQASIVNSNQTFTNYEAFFQSYRQIILNKLNELDVSVKKRHDLSSQYEKFNDVKRAFKQIEWLLHEIPVAVNNVEATKYFTSNDTLYNAFKNSMGKFQLLEKALIIQDHLTTILTIQQLKTFFQSLELTNNLNEDQAAHRIGLQLYQHYLLDLTGYYRIHYEENAIEEVIEALKIYHQILNKRQDVSVQIKELIGYLQTNNDFNQLDRISLLKDYIEPICQNLSSDNSNIQQHIRLNQSLFSINFFNIDAFSELTSSISSKRKMSDLGQLLFFEPALSDNNKRTCASCHKPQKAFTDGRQTSLGFQFSNKLERNAPTLINVMFNQSFGHDNAKPTLEAQTLFVINSHQEFNTSIDSIIKKLSNSNIYTAYFRQAFPDKKQIDKESILSAITAYMETITDLNSDFDKYMRDEITEIDPIIQQGYQLFLTKAQCGTCHFPPFFSGFEAVINQENHIGTHHIPTNDVGVSNLPVNSLFKVPTLRNLSYTLPYMHNGYFFEADEMLEHIFKQQESNTEPLNEVEKKAIKTFLLSLSSLHTPQLEETIQLPEMNNDQMSPKNRRAGGFY